MIGNTRLRYQRLRAVLALVQSELSEDLVLVLQQIDALCVQACERRPVVMLCRADWRHSGQCRVRRTVSIRMALCCRSSRREWNRRRTRRSKKQTRDSHRCRRARRRRLPLHSSPTGRLELWRVPPNCETDHSECERAICGGEDTRPLQQRQQVAQMRNRISISTTTSTSYLMLTYTLI